MGRPEAFYHNAALTLEQQAGADRAIVVGLSILSEQLDHLIGLLEPPPPDTRPKAPSFPARPRKEHWWQRVG